MSVLDYFLLLPSDTFEGPSYTWLDVMRANGEMIDKENGYMNCPGDGAQPEFEVALFRYRDGRPLLALCAGELEGTDSVTSNSSNSELTAKCRKFRGRSCQAHTSKTIPEWDTSRKAGNSNCREKAAQSSCDQKRRGRSCKSSPGPEKNFRKKSKRACAIAHVVHSAGASFYFFFSFCNASFAVFA